MVRSQLPATHKAIAKHVVEFRNTENLITSYLVVVLDAVVFDRVFFFIQDDKARSRIIVSGLSDASDVYHTLFFTKSEKVIRLVRPYKFSAFQKDPWNMRVTLKAILFKSAD